MSIITPQSEIVEIHRDRTWRREPERSIADLVSAERFIDSVGFCSALTDSRRPGASLYIAVCGRRDVYAPRNIQKDPEMGLAWILKDQIIRSGRSYYGKLRGNRSIFVSRRLVAHFHAVFTSGRRAESALESEPSKRILTILRKEWEMTTGDLRIASGIVDRRSFMKAIDELQGVLQIIPSDVVYEPKFTYIWTLAKTRFERELKTKVSKEEALKEIAKAYLAAAGMTARGELARVTGLSNPDAGLGNWALVDEGFALRVAPGVYSLSDLR
ncbi:MAG: hypothetical protein ABR501_08865 [Pyrinomonadaceae bacterium]